MTSHGVHPPVTPEVATTATRQTAIENTVLHLDAIEDISELTSLLTPTVRPSID
jgi:hypothetical protein